MVVVDPPEPAPAREGPPRECCSPLLKVLKSPADVGLEGGSPYASMLSWMPGIWLASGEEVPGVGIERDAGGVPRRRDLKVVEPESVGVFSSAGRLSLPSRARRAPTEPSEKSDGHHQEAIFLFLGGEGARGGMLTIVHVGKPFHYTTEYEENSPSI